MLKWLDTEEKSFYHKVAGSVITHVSMMLLSFAVSVFITRALGPAGRGSVAWAMSFATIGTALAQMGVAAASRKYSAADENKAGSLFILNMLVSFIGSLLVIPVLYFIGFQEAHEHKDVPEFMLGILVIPFMVIFVCSSELLAGIHRVREYNRVFTADKVLFSLFFLFLLITGMVNPFNVLAAFFAVAIIKNFISVYYLKDKIKFKELNLWKNFITIRKFMAISFITIISAQASFSILPIFIGKGSGFKELGIFAAAKVIIDAMSVMPNILGIHALPRLMRIKEHGNLRERIIKMLLITFVLLSFASAPIYLFSNEIIDILYGKAGGFSSSGEVLKILLIGVVLQGVMTVSQASLSSTDKEGVFLIITPLSNALIILGLGYILMQGFDAIMAAKVYAISNAFSLMTSLLLLVKVKGF